MRVCHITNYLPSYHYRFGGAEQAAERVINLEASKGVENVIITSFFDKKTKFSNIYGIPILEKYLGKFGTFLKLIIPFDFFSYCHILKILKKTRPDLVHLHNFNDISLSAISAAKKLNLPIVYSVYDYWTICPTAMLLKPEGEICGEYRSINCFNCVKKKNGGIIRALFLPLTNLFFKKSIKKIDRFIVLSKSSKEIMADYGINANKIMEIPLPFEIPEIKKIKIEKNSIFYAGWIEPAKGLDVLIDAMNFVVKKIPDAKLYVVGSYNSNPAYFSQIKSMIEKSNLEKNVFILGRKSTHELKNILLKSEIVAIPEQWENMAPLLLIESMSLEKPVVASDIGGMSEFIENGKNGFLVEPKNFCNLAEKIVELLKNRAKAGKFGKISRKLFLNRFNNQETFKKLISAYHIKKD